MTEKHHEVLIAGYGFLGRAIARELSKERIKVSGLNRSGGSEQGVSIIKHDLLAGPAHLKKYTAAIICLSPDGRNPELYYRTYVKAAANVLNSVSDIPVYFISSTAVYPQDDGRRVDVGDEAAEGFRAEILSEAEDQILSFNDQSKVLRFSGIYGPGREYLLRRIRSGDLYDQDAYTNRIHVTDGARFISYLLHNQMSDSRIFNVTDTHPALRSEVFNTLAEKMQLPQRMPAGARPGGKQISNRSVAATGFKYQYPTYKEGYTEIIDGFSFTPR